MNDEPVAMVDKIMLKYNLEFINRKSTKTFLERIARFAIAKVRKNLMPLLLRKTVQNLTKGGKKLRRRGGPRRQVFNPIVNVKKEKSEIMDDNMNCNIPPAIGAIGNHRLHDSPMSTITPSIPFRDSDIYEVARNHFRKTKDPIVFNSIDEMIAFSTKYNQESSKPILQGKNDECENVNITRLSLQRILGLTDIAPIDFENIGGINVQAPQMNMLEGPGIDHNAMTTQAPKLRMYRGQVAEMQQQQTTMMQPPTRITERYMDLGEMKMQPQQNIMQTKYVQHGQTMMPSLQQQKVGNNQEQQIVLGDFSTYTVQHEETHDGAIFETNIDDESKEEGEKENQGRRNQKKITKKRKVHEVDGRKVPQKYKGKMRCTKNNCTLEMESTEHVATLNTRYGPGMECHNCNIGMEEYWKKVKLSMVCKGCKNNECRYMLCMECYGEKKGTRVRTQTKKDSQ